MPGLDKKLILETLEQLPAPYSEIAEHGKSPKIPDTPINRRFATLAPPDEQRQIIAYLDDLQVKIDTLKRLHFETAAELDAMLPSILDKAFQGAL